MRAINLCDGPRQISFFGGEPLLQFDLIRDVVETVQHMENGGGDAVDIDYNSTDDVWEIGLSVGYDECLIGWEGPITDCDPRGTYSWDSSGCWCDYCNFDCGTSRGDVTVAYS